MTTRNFSAGAGPCARTAVEPMAAEPIAAMPPKITCRRCFEKCDICISPRETDFTDATLSAIIYIAYQIISEDTNCVGCLAYTVWTEVAPNQELKVPACQAECDENSSRRRNNF